MKKSFLFGLLAMLLAGFGFGGVSLADDLDCSENAVANSGVVACINNTTGYTTLALAIANAQDNDTISLMDDITFTANIDGYIYAYVEKSININLNGHTIDPDDNVLWFKGDIEASIYSGKIIDEDKNGELFVSDGASLTIKDGEYKGVGYYPVIHIKQGGDLTIENATITSTHSAAGACIYNEGTLTIENANITALNYLGIQNEGTLTIENATIIAPNYLGISNKGTLTIENATITAKSGIKNHAGKDITINDVTITTTNGKGIQNEGTLTIENGTISTTNEHNISTLSGSILTINDGTFSHADDYGILYVEGDTTVTIDSGDFSSDGWLIVGNGSEGKGGYTININGGTFTTLGDFPAIYHPNNGTLNITDGTFEGADALYLKSGETNISGGKFIGKGSQVDFEHRNDGIKPTGDGVVVEVCDYPGGEPTINITAGEFESDNADSIASYAQEGYTALTGFLVGGIFSPEPDESYISDGYYAKEIDDDKYEITEIQEITSIDITGITTPVAGATQTLDGIEITTTPEDAITIESEEWTVFPGDNSSAYTMMSGEIFNTENSYSFSIVYRLKTGYKLSDTTAYPENSQHDIQAGENPGYYIVIPYDVASGYTVTRKNGNNVLETDENVAHGSQPSYDSAEPTKAATSSYTYTFSGWSKDGTNIVNLASETITENTTYLAVFTSKKKSSGGGGGGSNGGSTTTTNTNTNTGDITNTNTGNITNTTEENKDSEENKDENLENSLPEVVNYNPDIPADKQILADGLTPELHYAYNFALENGITTMPTIQEAAMESPLTRIAMAKMLSQYAINILGKAPDTTKTISFPDVSAELDTQYNNGVTLAYQLGIMGIGIDEFRPFDLVTRAEFVTALSRMLYGLADGEGLYYETHMQKLLDEKIITVANPNMQELRGYVMIMLMRSAENK